MKNRNQKIVPNLWFDNNAEEAVKFYTSLFPGSGVNSETRYPEAGQEVHGQQPGSVMIMDFHLFGYKLTALNGGADFKFNPSISLFVLSQSEKEIGELWEELQVGGKVLMPLDSYEWSEKYAWVEDRFGLNWQLMLEPESTTSQKIVPMLFFTGQKHGKAEEAIKFYTSVFENSKIERILKYGETDRNEYALGSVKFAQFELEDETFMAMDSGMENDFPFNEAVSFIVNCKDQNEIDRFWEKLSAGGGAQAQQCGWLKDKFGVSWQVVPEEIGKIMNNPDKEKTNRAMEALLRMKKIDLEILKNA